MISDPSHRPVSALRQRMIRALIATLTYSFARITAALKMKVEDLRPRGAGWTIRLHEKGGKQHSMPCHHALAEALRAYIDAAGIVDDRNGWLFGCSAPRAGTTAPPYPKRPRCCSANLMSVIVRIPGARARSTPRTAEAGFRSSSSAATCSARSASRPATRSKTPRPWPRMKARARSSSTFNCSGLDPKRTVGVNPSISLR